MTSAGREDRLTPNQNTSPATWNKSSQMKTKRKSKGVDSLGHHILKECSQAVEKGTTEVCKIQVGNNKAKCQQWSSTYTGYVAKQEDKGIY